MAREWTAQELEALMDEVAAEVGDWFEGERPPGEVIDFKARAALKARGLDPEHGSGAPAEGV